MKRLTTLSMCALITAAALAAGCQKRDDVPATGAGPGTTTAPGGTSTTPGGGTTTPGDTSTSPGTSGTTGSTTGTTGSSTGGSMGTSPAMPSASAASQ